MNSSATNKILIITDQALDELISGVEQIRGQKPLVLRIGGNPYELEKWVFDYKSHGKNHDLVVEWGDSICGFEWPTVLVISSKHPYHEFSERNKVMRAMSRLETLGESTP